MRTKNVRPLRGEWFFRAYNKRNGDLREELPLNPFGANPIPLLRSGVAGFVEFDADPGYDDRLACIRQVLLDFEDLDYRKKRAVSAEELAREIREALA